MEPDAEHQQDHADLGELVGKPLVGHVAGREGADEDAGQKVPDEGRNLDAMGERTKNEGQHETDDDR